MYTRRSSFPLKPSTSDQAVEIARKYGTVLRDLPGHVSTVMFLDGDDFMSITTWDTEEQAQGVQSVRDQAQRDLADLLADAPASIIAETAVHNVRR